MAYPDRLEDVTRLIEQHRRLEHQTLLLALYYASEAKPDDYCLLEVIAPFGYNEVSEDQELFEMQYGSTPGFPLATGSGLDILLTNVPEVRMAIRHEWPSILPVLEAVRLRKYQVLHVEGEGAIVLEDLQRDLVAA